MTAIAILHRDEIIDQAAQGILLHRIAKGLGIAPCSVSKHLANDPEYRQARQTGAELRLHVAMERLDECADGVTVEGEDGEKVRIDEKGNLARARAEAWRAAAWFAEREFPERFATKGQSINIQVNVAGADQLLAGSAVAMLAEIVPAEASIPQCTIEKKDAE